MMRRLAGAVALLRPGPDGNGQIDLLAQFVQNGQQPLQAEALQPAPLQESARGCKGRRVSEQRGGRYRRKWRQFTTSTIGLIDVAALAAAMGRVMVEMRRGQHDLADRHIFGQGR